MSHNSSISGMGGPVQAIRVINEKQLLLIMVGNNIILIDRNCNVLPKYYDLLIVMFVCIQYLMLNKIVRACLF
jgi:hypothetical protein